MRDPAPAAVIVGTGDGALGASSKVAMVDRGLDVASLAGNDDAIVGEPLAQPPGERRAQRLVVCDGMNRPANVEQNDIDHAIPPPFHAEPRRIRRFDRKRLRDRFGLILMQAVRFVNTAFALFFYFSESSSRLFMQQNCR